VEKVFLQLTSLGKASRLRRILQSPFTLHESLIKLIRREARNAEAGKAARIIVKVNSLIETQIIQALYDASRAGVKIDLVVRGVCRLRPGVAGVSDNITVRSIVGRFLEHTRVFYFGNDGDPQVFCASADWMERNFFRRVEVCFPVQDEALRSRVIKDIEYYLKDNMQAWLLQPEGTYRRAQPGRRAPFSAQAALMQDLAESA